MVFTCSDLWGQTLSATHSCLLEALKGVGSPLETNHQAGRNKNLDLTESTQRAQASPIIGTGRTEPCLRSSLFVCVKRAGTILAEAVCLQTKRVSHSRRAVGRAWQSRQFTPCHWHTEPLPRKPRACSALTAFGSAGPRKLENGGRPFAPRCFGLGIPERCVQDSASAESATCQKEPAACLFSKEAWKGNRFKCRKLQLTGF